ncbi:extracellular matrix protein 3 [Caerostris extrusa]|uniref:Extracellular matrix protein 3 n=1 Tax=Caerostris extrusa TaxID=172846 RepID=A0AAV4NR92_CAEEX|nr:extracellular matrix protein 3 [Caerostris extrusa]
MTNLYHYYKTTERSSENTDFPGVPITSFTQLDIAGSKIYYVHTRNDEVKMDNFEFGKELTSLNPLEDGNIGFRFFNQKVLREKIETVLESTLTYIITKPPKHGIIINKDFSNKTISNFTQDDINKMKIFYILDPETNVTSDIFHFKIVDGEMSNFLFSIPLKKCHIEIKQNPYSTHAHPLPFTQCTIQCPTARISSIALVTPPRKSTSVEEQCTH